MNFFQARAWPPSVAPTDVHWPKMPGATSLTMAHGTTPAAAPGPSSALAISTWPSSLAVATTKTPLAAQAAVSAAIRSAVGGFVGVNFFQAFALPPSTPSEGKAEGKCERCGRVTRSKAVEAWRSLKFEEKRARRDARAAVEAR